MHKTHEMLVNFLHISISQEQYLQGGSYKFTQICIQCINNQCLLVYLLLQQRYVLYTVCMWLPYPQQNLLGLHYRNLETLLSFFSCMHFQCIFGTLKSTFNAQLRWLQKMCLDIKVNYESFYKMHLSYFQLENAFHIFLNCCCYVFVV